MVFDFFRRSSLRRGGLGRGSVPGALGLSTPTLESGLASRARRVQVRTHRLVSTALAGGYRSTFRGSGVEFSEVRPYMPGDEVRRIDWNVTARAGVAFIKNFQEERELTLHFLVDTSRSMDVGSRGRSKRAAAAQFCGLLTLVATRHQDRVGLSLFGSEPGLHVGAKKGGQHGLRVFREVREAPPTDGGSDFGAVLEQACRALRRRGVVFFVSDFLDQGAAPAPGRRPWPELLAQLSRRHDVIAVRVTDPIERALPSAGIVELAEVETGARLEVDTRSSAVREAWATAATRRRAEQDAIFARARVDVIELDTGADLGDPIVAFFRRRAARRGGRA